MGSSNGKYDWDLLLTEYLKSGMNKSQFAESKGINPSYLRRFTKDWPDHKKPKKEKVAVTKKVKKIPVTPKKEKIPKKKVTSVTFKISKEEGKTVQEVLTSTEFENPDDLNSKEQAFCIFYNRNPNVGLAIMKAGYNCKNMDSAACYGYQKLGEPKIRKEIERLRKIRLAAMSLTVEDITSKIVDMHMAIGFADAKDTVDFGTRQVPLRNESGAVISLPDPKTKELKPVMVSENFVELFKSDRVDGRIIHKISQSSRGGFSVAFEDRKASLQWLAEYFSINPMDKHKMEYDKKRIELEEKSVNAKIKTGESITEAIQQAGAQTQTLAALINKPLENRKIGDYDNG